MAKSFKKLIEGMSPERRAKIEAKKNELRKEMALGELRSAVEMSQTRMAEIMGVAQSEISKIEKRSDMYVSTVRSYVEAAGGSLRIVADMPGFGEVQITKFGEILGGVPVAANEPKAQNVQHKRRSARRAAG
jgi:transcriptional regulator with XRE-family HTH domain